VTAFYVLGGVLAAWALLVSALGVRNHDFPGAREKIVSGISVLLVVAAVSAAIIGAANEDHGGGHGEAEQSH
jgi:hypothetical protein